MKKTKQITFLLTVSLILSSFLFPTNSFGQTPDGKAPRTYALEELLLQDAIRSIAAGLESPGKVIRLRIHLKKGETLSNEVLKFEGLQALEISGPGFKTLPRQLRELRNLQYVELRSCPKADLETVFTSLKNCPKLISLSLKDFAKKIELPENIGELSKLQYLKLQGFKLDSLPNSISKLNQLKHLDLRNTGLDTLSPSFSKLTQLETLFLGSGFKKFPIPVLRLQELKYLSLKNSQLETLPMGIAQLQSLHTLDLSGTNLNIEKSMKVLIEMQGLIILDLSNSHLTELPQTAGKLQIEQLNLSGNGFSALPPSVIRMKNLMILDLSNNRFLPESLEVIEQLLPRVEITF